MSEPTLVLVDGSSYLYRAFHAMPPLMTSKGQATGAIKGVLNMVRRAAKDWPDAHLVIVFDAKGKTFRDDIYPEYKANRPPMPDDLRSQIPFIHSAINAMGLPLLVVPGVEADDVIGTLAHLAVVDGMQVIVSTGDKDMAQLVNKQVTLVNTMNESVLDEAGVSEKFGISPAHIIDYLALMGDKVDNIPGVPGVGEKTALGLIQHLGGIDDIYRRLDEVASVPVRGAKTLAAKLEAEEDKARLSYRLATIKTDVPLPFTLAQLTQSPPDTDSLMQLYTDLEFKTWVAELAAGESAVEQEPVNVAKQYELVLDQAHFERWLEQLRSADLFAFDTETTSLDYMQAAVVGVSFAVEPYKAAYVPFGHDYIDAPEQLSEDYVLGALKPLLEDSKQIKLGQNLKYDRHVLLNHGINLQGIAHDTMLASYVLDAAGSRHDMDSLALKYLGETTVKFVDIAGKGKKQLTFNQIALAQAAPYAAEDADITLRLHEVLQAKLPDACRPVYADIEMPLVTVLGDIERNGALIDQAMLGRQSTELAARLQQIEQQAFDMAGQPFNLASPKQLGEILFEKLQLPVIKKTKTGAPSTAEEVLQELALDYPLPALLLDYRSLSKLKSTYTDKLPDMVNPATGRIHTSYHQAVAATGRLSSSDPNLQNIPIRSAEGRRIRQAFIAPDGYAMVAADYSQIELRIMAHLSGDAALLEAFRNGLDIHRATAAEVNGIELAAVSDEDRRRAKAVNFGLIYGMSSYGLARQLKIPVPEAKAYIDLYFERYPGVQAYMERIREQAKACGYVETLFGRRLYLPEINAANGMRRQAAERTAINAPMQGTAADIIKRAMIRVQQWLREEQVPARMIMQVHDELVFEVRDTGDTVAQFSADVARVMAGAAELNVPLLVDVGRGKNWDEAH